MTETPDVIPEPNPDEVDRPDEIDRPEKDEGVEDTPTVE